MKDKVLSVLKKNVGEYTGYEKNLLQPPLRQFMVTIIDQEKNHLEEFEALDGEVFEGQNPDDFAEELKDLAASRKIEPGVDGLKQVHDCELAMAELFRLMSVQAQNEDAAVLFKQFADEETKHAELVQTRLDLETL